ncbi:MAG: hypothetical protein KI790_11645 [Cyclobacteriaceae bacterium]|nr:hypothetical protein [Cyclobacteriaceae bacterium HetDA_MAG_MS6]
MDLLENLKPRSIGPAGMAGRVTAIDVVIADPDVMYVGTASGGLWKSESGGIKWTPIFEKEITASIGAVAIQQSNPSVIWVGTGEGNPRNSLNGGNGIYRSLDAGKSWTKMGLDKTRHIHRIVIDPTAPNTIYVGAIGSPWGAHPERGVYKTTDGGVTWRKVLSSNNRSGVADLVMDPFNPNKLIAALWEHNRTPWFFKSGGEGSGLHITHDGGETWKKLTDEDGLPKGELGRIGIAIARSNPKIVYALIESKDNALYRSEDGGFNWKMINTGDDIGNRPFYYSDIYVDPSNENRVFSIFTYVNVSEDGGKSFKQLMPAYNTTRGVHPDHHAWWIHPENPDFMIDGNDGGLNITRDRGKSWRFVQNIPVAQFYHITVDNELPYNVYGGMQDNGSWAGPAYVWKAQGIRNDYWQEISFGDGFDVLPDPENYRYGISTAQQGYAGIYDRQTGYFEFIRPTYPEEDVVLRFNWNVGLARDPFDNKTIYFGSQFVHKSTDGGQTWDVISPDLTTNDPDKQKQKDTGGLTIDDSGAENHCTILVISPSPSEKDVIWVGTDDGRVQITKDGGNSWSDVAARIPGLPAGSWIAQIKPSQSNKGEALLVANDYRRFNYSAYAYRTKDYGQTWQRIVDNDDASSYALCIVEDVEESKLMFLGTDDGLYLSIDAGSSWVKWHEESFPTTNVMDLIIHPRESDLIIGTFGRAAYVLDDIRPLREIAASNGSALTPKLNVYTPPTAYVVASQQASGSRFGADGIFNGENRSTNAIITYSINRPEKKEEQKEATTSRGKKNRKKDPPLEESDKQNEKEDKVRYDSLKLEVFDQQDKLIRTVKQKAPEKNGIHKILWDKTEKGLHSLTRSEINTKNEPSGITVLPGMYKVRLSFGDQKDSTTIEVKYDPRLALTNTEITARYEAMKDLDISGGLALKAVERLKKSIKIVEDFSKKFSKKDKEGLKTQIDSCKYFKDTLNVMLDKFLGPEDKRQGFSRGAPDAIIAYYNSARFYTSNALHAPTSTENKLINRFKESLTPQIETVNTFFENDWPKFKALAESVDLSPFTALEKLE